MKRFAELLIAINLAGCASYPTDCITIFEECNYETECIQYVGSVLKCENDKPWFDFWTECEKF